MYTTLYYQELDLTLFNATLKRSTHDALENPLKEWTEIFHSDNTLVAQLKARLLEQHGITPTLRNENLAALVGMGGLGLPCRVFVPSAQADKATQILQRADGPTLVSSIDEPETCPHCNAPWEVGFDICWKCER